MTEDPRKEVDIPLCPGCLEPVPFPGHFCSCCGMPLTPYATTAPLEQVWAFGWLVNRLLTRRPTRIGVVGTCGLALPHVTMLLPFVGYVVAAARAWFVQPQTIPGLVDLQSAVVSIELLLIACLYVVLVLRVLRSYLRPESNCDNCGYDLSGHKTGVCPECGSATPESSRPRSRAPPHGEA